METNLRVHICYTIYYPHMPIGKVWISSHRYQVHQWLSAAAHVTHWSIFHSSTTPVR